MNARRIMAYAGFALAGGVLARIDVPSILAEALHDVLQSPVAIGSCVVLAAIGVVAATGIGVPRGPVIDDISLWARSDAYRSAVRIHEDWPMGVGLARSIGETPPRACRMPDPFPDGHDSRTARDFSSAMRTLDTCASAAIDLYGRTGTTTYLDRIGDAVDRDGRIDAIRLSTALADMTREHPFAVVTTEIAEGGPMILSAYERMRRRTGRTIPTTHVWWMKRIDRSLWYAFLNVGRDIGMSLWPEGIELSNRIEDALSNVPSPAMDALPAGLPRETKAPREMGTVHETAAAP